ncbi:MAG: hypothetical protein K2X93_22175 [Candidatus Obscuribacterales bacterium]|nr:hypothetical protein [Candidatus Obscuribacterales bacterium]
MFERRVEETKMDLGKMRGTRGRTDESASDDSVSGNGTGRKVPARRSEKKSIKDNKALREGMGGLSAIWGNYTATLSAYFKSMSRDAQEQLITRLCQVITVGSAIVLTSFFYQFIPLPVRVFAMPVFIVGSWFVATRVVAPIIIAQFEDKLNNDDR